MNTIDQNIWRERIKKENGASQKFDVTTMVNAETSHLCNNYAVVRPFVRDNSSPQQVKNRPYYMVDSSYTVPSNPNTMRDNGPLRNAQYRVYDQAEEEHLKKTSQNGFNQTGGFSVMSFNQNDINKMKDTLNTRCSHKRPFSNFGNNTQTTGFYQQGHTQHCNVIEKVVVVRTNDYTKNISSAIFTPGYSDSPPTKRYTKAETIQSPQKTLQKGHSGGKSQANIRVKTSLNFSSGRRNNINSIEKELKNEKERRAKLTKEIGELRDQMSTFYSLASKKNH